MLWRSKNIGKLTIPLLNFFKIGSVIKIPENKTCGINLEGVHRAFTQNYHIRFLMENINYYWEKLGAAMDSF